MFYATGGRHLNSNEFFKARALAERDQRIKELEQRKKALQAVENLDNAATALLQAKGNLTDETAKNFTVADIKLLLKWKKVKPTSSKKIDLLTAYYNHPSPNTLAPREQWTDADEIELVALRSDNINMRDTALGVATTQMARAVTLNLKNLDADTRAELMRALEEDADDHPTMVL